MKKPIGQTVIQRYREKKGMTQAQLAAFIGATYSAVSRWEREDRKHRPSGQTAKNLAIILGVSSDSIMLDYGPKPQRHVRRWKADEPKEDHRAKAAR